MAFGRQQTIEDLTGINAEEFKRQLGAGKTAAEKAALLETALNELKTSQQSQFDESKLGVKALTERTPVVPPVNNGGDGNGGDGDDNHTSDGPQWGDDANAAFKHHFSKSIEPLVIGQINTNVDIALQSMQDKHGQLFNGL